MCKRQLCSCSFTGRIWIGRREGEVLIVYLYSCLMIVSINARIHLRVKSSILLRRNN